MQQGSLWNSGVLFAPQAVIRVTCTQNNRAVLSYRESSFKGPTEVEAATLPILELSTLLTLVESFSDMS
jgi:hypothetical protein